MPKSRKRKTTANRGGSTGGGGGGTGGGSLMGFRRGFKKLVRGGSRGGRTEGNRFWDVLFYILLALAAAVLVYRLWHR